MSASGNKAINAEPGYWQCWCVCCLNNLHGTMSKNSPLNCEHGIGIRVPVQLDLKQGSLCPKGLQ